MANKKEKIFTLMYDTNEPTKLHKFIDELCEYKKDTDNKKYLHWARYCGFYTLATLENTYWNVNNLSDAIYKHMENNIKFIIFEIQDAPAQGRMSDGYWNFWKDSQNLSETIANYSRARKLKKITSYINKKADLKRKEQEIERRKIELKKAIDLKNREDELKAQERELEEMEKQLNSKPNEQPKKKLRWWK